MVEAGEMTATAGFFTVGGAGLAIAADLLCDLSR